MDKYSIFTRIRNIFANMIKDSNNYRSFSVSEEQDIILSYQSGLTSAEVSRKHNCGSSSVRNIIIRNGLKMRPSVRTRRHTITNESFFKVINTESKAYLLGIMFTDGSISSVYNRIYLGMTDLEVLEYLKSNLGCTHPISLDKQRVIGHSKFYSIHISSKIIRDDLVSHGCTQRKTLTAVYPTINKNLERHFVRGLIDGDGCVAISKINAVSCDFTSASIKLISGYKLFLDSLGCKYSTQYGVNRKEPSKAITVRSFGDSCRKLLEEIYGNSSFSIDRKFNKYKLITKHG